ncbi:MAG: phage major capsid protein, partial [Hyphococcus sp.]
ADWDINSRTMSGKHVGALTEFSRNLVLQADPSVNDMTTRDAARALASALDSAALIGGGSNQPDGIITQLTAGPGLGTWATPTWAEGLQLIADVESDDAAMGSLGWAIHPAVRKKLRSTLVAASTDSRMIMADPNELYGYPAFASTGLTLGSPSGGPAIFGDFSSLVVGYWSGVDVLANPYESTAYSKGNIQVRCLLTADVMIRHIESFQAANDMATA